MRNGMGQQVKGGASGAPQNVEQRLAEHKQAVASGAIQRAVLAARGQVDPNQPKGHPAPPPKRYRVLNGGTIVWQGCRTSMRAGKEITDAQYDVRMLKRQGIRLEPIVEDDDHARAIPNAEPATSSADEIAAANAEADRATQVETDRIRSEREEDGKAGRKHREVPSPQDAPK